MQMSEERFPSPHWIITGAGTGGTSATLGRYVRYMRKDTQICVADPDNSVFFDHFVTGDHTLTTPCGSRIEGIGRPRVEPSFQREVVDAMVKVPDSLSLAALSYLEEALGYRVGASTGTNFCAALACALEMRKCGQSGSIVAILCDGGERYLNRYYNDTWLQSNGFGTLGSYRDRIKAIATDPHADSHWLDIVRQRGVLAPTAPVPHMR